MKQPLKATGTSTNVVLPVMDALIENIACLTDLIASFTSHGLNSWDPGAVLVVFGKPFRHFYTVSIKETPVGFQAPLVLCHKLYRSWTSRGIHSYSILHNHVWVFWFRKSWANNTAVQTYSAEYRWSNGPCTQHHCVNELRQHCFLEIMILVVCGLYHYKHKQRRFYLLFC